PAATSSAAAAGLWQFIPSTGRIYGLQQTGMYDGRRDVVESTRAAYEFLGSLYNQFGSWELALAAYNAGPGRIQQAINRNQAAGLPTDYWSLKLPQETMNYVPRFLAVAQIIKNPRAYGVSLPPIANRPHFREVTLSAPLSLNEIASVTGLSRAELYALNPGYRGETVDPASPMRILIPADVSPSVDNKLKAMKAGGSSSGWWANVTSPSKPTTTTSTSVTVKTTPATQVQPVRPTTPTKTTGSSVTVKTSTPRGSDALAAFAASADVPSAPRIPVAVTPATNVKPVRTEPPISAVEREKILAAVRAEGEKETVEQALQPQATQAEKDQVVAELKAIAPQGTEIVDPYDGKIKLTAIQTSLSVAEQQGKELSKGFAYPKTLAEDASVANSEDGQRNKDKPYIKTDTDVVVVQPKGKRSTYTVQPGDTLAIIAMKNGVNWRDVAKWNQIDPEKTLFVGTSLYLYDAKPQEVESTAKSAAKPDVYVVQANDSLTGVANQFNLSVKQLAEYNDLSVSDGLFVGQKLHLKEPKGNRTSAKAEQPKAVQASTRRIATKSYTVKRGEYLKLIADRYALSNQELAELTPGLSAGSNLMVGQKINVPAKEVTVDEVDDNKASGKYEKLAAGPSYKTESYKVQRGDTLSSIAIKSKISLAELAELNNLKANSHVQLGQNLKVPAGVSVPDHYVVQSGDSLHAIAAKYNLQTSYLADLNGLSRTAGVRAGQRLKLTGEVETPSKTSTKNVKEETPETYTVKSGDSLGNIANRYHLQLDYLASLNGLSRNSNVRVGQRLKLTGDVPPVETAKVDTAKSAAKPVAAGKNTEKYTVKAGESLHTIASRAGISVRELAEMNALKANANLQRGQNIVIPKTVVEYKVKRGDTLIGLASKYGLETTLLAELNNLTPSTQLRIGDIIKVPNL
ncbi:MAG TPA: lytic transglycosylase, partial [Acinetobacter nosocomialis]|nr:lytic transglycosylase [Acinetobacter nosocomialis]